MTLIWGTTFSLTRSLETDPAHPISPASLTLLRFVISAAVFAPFLRKDRRLWRVGLELGFWLWCGYASQANGLRTTTAGRSAFITSLNVVFVPLIVAAAGGRVGWRVWLAAGIALAGTALLSYDGAPPNRGDAWTLVTAITYAVYIVRLERSATHYGPLQLSAVQSVGVALWSLGWFVGDAWHSTLSPGFALADLTWGAIGRVVYLGIVATAATTWLQAIGQRTVPGPQASLLYTMEPVWASLFARAFFDERFGSKGGAGAAMILLAAMMSQAPTALPSWARRVPTRP